LKHEAPNSPVHSSERPS